MAEAKRSECGMARSQVHEGQTGYVASCGVEEVLDDTLSDIVF